MVSFLMLKNCSMRWFLVGARQYRGQKSLTKKRYLPYYKTIQCYRRIERWNHQRSRQPMEIQVRIVERINPECLAMTILICHCRALSRNGAAVRWGICACVLCAHVI